MQFNRDEIQLIRNTHWLGGFAELMMQEAFGNLILPEKQNILLLDIGCGGGNKTDILRRCGVNTIGLERDLDRLRQASRQYPKVQFMAAEAIELPFLDEQFDMVFSFSVFQYIDWQEMVRESYRVLKPGGVSIFIENLAAYPLAIVYRLFHKIRGWRYPDYQTPVQHLNWSEIHFIKERFSQVDVTPFHLLTPFVLIKPIVLNRLFRRDLQPPALAQLQRLSVWDQKIIKNFELVSPFCWNVIIHAKK